LYSSSSRSKNLYTAQVPEGAKLYKKGLYSSSFKSTNLYTAQVPEGAKFYKKRLYSSSSRSKNLYTAQVPEGAKLYRSKRKHCTARISEVKTCILYTAQVPEGAKSYCWKKIYSSSFRSKKLVYGSSSTRSKITRFKNYYTAQVSQVKTSILYRLYCSNSRRSEIIPFKK